MNIKLNPTSETGIPDGAKVDQDTGRVVTRADVTLRLVSTATAKGKEVGKPFFNLDTAKTAFKDLVHFIGEEAALQTLVNSVRRTCIEVSRRHFDDQKKEFNLDKIVQDLTSMTITRVSLAQLEEEFQNLAVQLSEFDLEGEFTDVQRRAFIDIKSKMKAVKSQMDAIKKARAEKAAANAEAESDE